MTIHEFIKERKHLIWYVRNYDALDEASIVEATLNYGNWDDVKLLFSILGVKRVAEIFKKQTTNRPWGRMNYHKLTARYFNLYFWKHVPDYEIEDETVKEELVELGLTK